MTANHCDLALVTHGEKIRKKVIMVVNLSKVLGCSLCTIANQKLLVDNQNEIFNEFSCHKPQQMVVMDKLSSSVCIYKTIFLAIAWPYWANLEI